jgi:hypothetical protein
MINSMRTLLAAAFAAFAFTSTPAMAQDFENLDEGSSKKAKKKGSFASGSDIVREIERGYYLKANVGSTMFLLVHPSPILSPGTTTSISGGGDFMDRERMSMAWEVSFEQGLHNGAKYTDQVSLPPSQLIQGDIHTFIAKAMYEASWYLTRRFSLGVRAGGGVMLTPLLMNRAAYLDIVVAGQWGGNQPSVHESPHPMVGFGPTVEYYTKLSHFSIGADVDVFYALGFDLGLFGSGYLKYTF